jgi:hypothetical protein
MRLQRFRHDRCTNRKYADGLMQRRIACAECARERGKDV